MNERITEEIIEEENERSFFNLTTLITFGIGFVVTLLLTLGFMYYTGRWVDSEIAAEIHKCIQADKKKEALNALRLLTAPAKAA